VQNLLRVRCSQLPEQISLIIRAESQSQIQPWKQRQ